MPKILFFIALLFYPLSALSQTSPLVLNNSNSDVNAAKHIEYLEDPTRQLSLEQVSQASWSERFIQNESSKLNFGRSRSAFWLRFQVVNQSEEKWYLLLDSILGDEFNLYIQPISQKLSNTDFVTATNTEYATPLENHFRRAWSLDLPKGEVLQVYMRLTNGDTIISVPVDFLTADEMLAKSNANYKLNTAVYTGMIILALYQLFMFFILKEKNYFYLSTHIIAMMLTIHRSNPVFESLYFLSDTGSYFYTAPLLIAVITSAAFTRIMLSTEQSRFIDTGFKIFIGTSVFLIFIIGMIPQGNAITAGFGLLIIIYTFFSGFYMAYYKKVGPIAKYFAWAYITPTLLHIPNLLVGLFKVKSWQASFDLNPAIGSLLLMLFFAVLQAYRVRLLHEDIQRTNAANQAKDQFIAIMNHELRTPMNAVVGLTSLLTLEKLHDLQKDYVNRLANASQQMMQLINNVLDFSKTEQSDFELEQKPFRLNMTLNSSYQLMEQQARQKGLRLQLDSQTAPSLTVIGDRQRLTQILNNLLSNAVKYTQYGEVTLSATQLAHEPKNNSARLRFSVRDTGSGIPPDQIRTLFEPFRQLEVKNDLPHQEGVGLGLAISRRLVNKMGGQLLVDSQPDRGSEFYFELNMPLATDEEISASGNVDLTALRLPAGSRILLVDDSEANRFVGTEMLQNMGAKVGQANSGRHAILQLQKQHYDLILLDISMPDMDGLAVTHWIRQEHNSPNIPVIALTAHSSAEMQVKCKNAGINDFLGKPFEYRGLFQVTSQYLS